MTMVGRWEADGARSVPTSYRDLRRCDARRVGAHRGRVHLLRGGRRDGRGRARRSRESEGRAEHREARDAQRGWRRDRVREVRPDDKAPPSHCGAMLRVEVSPIVASDREVCRSACARLVACGVEFCRLRTQVRRPAHRPAVPACSRRGLHGPRHVRLQEGRCPGLPAGRWSPFGDALLRRRHEVPVRLQPGRRRDELLLRVRREARAVAGARSAAQ